MLALSLLQTPGRGGIDVVFCGELSNNIVYNNLSASFIILTRCDHAVIRAVGAVNNAFTIWVNQKFVGLY